MVTISRYADFTRAMSLGIDVVFKQQVDLGSVGDPGDEPRMSSFAKLQFGRYM